MGGQRAAARSAAGSGSPPESALRTGRAAAPRVPEGQLGVPEPGLCRGCCRGCSGSSPGLALEQPPRTSPTPGALRRARCRRRAESRCREGATLSPGSPLSASAARETAGRERPPCRSAQRTGRAARTAPAPRSRSPGPGPRGPSMGQRAPRGTAPRLTSSVTATVLTHRAFSRPEPRVLPRRKVVRGGFSAPQPPVPRRRPTARAAAAAPPRAAGTGPEAEGSVPACGSLRLRYRCCGRAAAILNAWLLPLPPLQGPAR